MGMIAMLRDQSAFFTLMAPSSPRGR